MRIRWATWWPVPYWTDRFNALALREDIELEVCFLAERSAVLPASANPDDWKFVYTFLSSGSDSAGYYKPVVRLRNPWPLIRGQFDALVMTYADPVCIAAAITCRLLNKPVVYFCPNTVNDFRRTNVVLERFKRQVLGLGTAIFATGPAQRQYIEEYVQRRVPIYEIGNPVKRMPTKRYLLRRKAIRKELGVGDDELLLVFVGRLSAEKGLRGLLDALVLCYRRGLRPKLFLVGEGAERDALRMAAETKGLAVEFHGFLEGEALAIRYAAADIFVLPSLSEPWGLVVNEAMGFGLPVLLSSNVGSCPVLLKNGRNGLSFPAGNVSALAEGIFFLGENAELRAQMGKESQRIINTQTIDSWVEAVVKAVRNGVSRTN